MATLFLRHGQPNIVVMEQSTPIRSLEEATRLSTMLEVTAAISLFLRRHPRVDNVNIIDTMVFWDMRDDWESDTVPISYTMGGAVEIDWPGVAPHDEPAIEKVIEFCAEEDIPVVQHRRAAQ
jgi:hypothetical protein